MGKSGKPAGHGKQQILRVIRYAAITAAFLMLTATILDIWLDAEMKTWNWFTMDLCGLPLCGLLLWELLRCKDIRRGHMRQIPTVLLFLLFGGYASYLSYPLLFLLLLPALFTKPEALPAREERPEAPRMAWLMLLLMAVILYNCEILMHIMGFRWSLQDGLAEIGTLLYPAAIILLCSAPLALRLRDDFFAIRFCTEAHAHRAVPVMLVSGVAFVIIRFLYCGALDLTAAVARPYEVALPLTFIAGVFLQPASDELIYRGLLRRVIRNKWAFALVSALLYGLFRSISQTGGILLLPEFAAYTVLGLGFSICYALTDNFFVPYFSNAFVSLVAVLAGLPMLQG